MASIIKATQSSTGGELAPFAFDDLTDRAQAELREAHRQATQIVAEAERRAIEICQAAEEQGRSAALAAIETVLEERISCTLNTLLPALTQAVSAIERSKAEWLTHWERAALRVSTAIAERVIRREVAQSPDITLDLVREALELAAGSADTELRMHPDDLKALGPYVERLVREVGRAGKATVVGDATITAGSCLVETRFGSIDQQFEAQLARIEQELS